MAKLGEISKLFFNRPNRVSPKPDKLDPDPNARQAIAYFASSLDLDVGSRQAKSQINDRSFRQMCRSVHEHPVRGEVRRVVEDFAASPLVFEVQIAKELNPGFSAGGPDHCRSSRAPAQENTPSVKRREGSAGSVWFPARGAPQKGQKR